MRIMLTLHNIVVRSENINQEIILCKNAIRPSFHYCMAQKVRNGGYCSVKKCYTRFLHSVVTDQSVAFGFV